MFAFRLAARLGKTVKQLLAEIDSRELSEWIAFDNVEVTDGWHQTAIMAQIASQAAGATTAKLEDFLPVKPQRSKSGPDPNLTTQILAWAKGFQQVCQQ